MDHNDHVRLIRDGIGGEKAWADLGAGQGAFTLALADVLGDSGEIYALGTHLNFSGLAKT